ncbi:Phospholipid-transporting ATPase 2 [Glycine max]|nr:Phospholipid-transporting ATPase 2 [Glycine max]
MEILESLYSYNSLRPKLIEPKGQLLSIDGKTEEEVCRSLERVLRTMRITTSEPKDVAFVVDGWALEIALTHYRKAFTELAVLSRTAICCRVTPSQKAQKIIALICTLQSLNSTIIGHSFALILASESLNTADHAAFDNHTSYMGSINGPKLPLVFEVQQMPHDLTTEGCPKNNFQNSCIFNKAPISAITNKKTYEEDTCVDKSNPQHESFIKRYSIKLASTSADLWMGIVLLFIDIMIALEILVRQVHGCKASGSQRKRLNRTMTDIIVLIPVTILMLIPVSTFTLSNPCDLLHKKFGRFPVVNRSIKLKKDNKTVFTDSEPKVTAVGHAAILAAIKKYMTLNLLDIYF